MCTDGYEKKVLFWQLIRHRHLTSIFHCEFWRRSLYFCKSSNLIRIRLVKPLLYDIKYHTRIPKIKFRILVFKKKGFILNLFCICPFCVLLLDFLYYSFFPNTSKKGGHINWIYSIMMSLTRIFTLRIIMSSLLATFIPAWTTQESI